MPGSSPTPSVSSDHSPEELCRISSRTPGPVAEDPHGASRTPGHAPGPMRPSLRWPPRPRGERCLLPWVVAVPPRAGRRMRFPGDPSRRGVIKPPPRLRTLLVVASVCFAVAGCGVAGPKSRTFVGPVTVMNAHRVCVGGPDASGECFVKSEATSSLRVSDCVRVTYVLHDSPGPSIPSSLGTLDGSRHASECPHQ
jgi:hypothetical protein